MADTMPAPTPVAAGTEPADTPHVPGPTPRPDAPSPNPTPLPSPASEPEPVPRPSAPSPDPAPPPSPTATASSPKTSAVASRPDWLGTRVLPDGPDGYPEPQDTPPELVDRRLPPTDPRPAPIDDGFTARVDAAAANVLARSTWEAGCPVAAEDLRHLTVTFWGFDDRAHTGELLVHADAADDLVEVFRAMFEARFPIEEVRIIGPDELDAPPTGDGNATTAFVCRPIRGSTSWSQHAYGLAVDINPFHNPYERDGRVLPELATAYLDRGDLRPGMIIEDDVVTEAFAAIGWGWGGDWTSLTDPMHFSATGT